jgi:hypothetical protein
VRETNPCPVLYCGYEGGVRESTVRRKNLRSDFRGAPAEEATAACGRPGLHIAGQYRRRWDGDDGVIHLGGEAAVVVPAAEYRRPPALQRLASTADGRLQRHCSRSHSRLVNWRDDNGLGCALQRMGMR